MPAPTVTSRVLQDDGRYLVTLSDGFTFYSQWDMEVNIIASALPAGAATEATLAAAKADLDTVDTSTAAVSTATGAQADAAVTTAVAGSLMGYLRALKEGWLARMPAALGSATSANSLPVVIASDQGSYTVKAQTNASSAPAATSVVALSGTGMKDSSGLISMMKSAGGTSGANAAAQDSVLAVAAYGYIGTGNTYDARRLANKFIPLSAVSINAETTIWTPASGKKFRLMGYVLVGSAAGNVTFKDNTAGTTIHVLPTPAGGAGIPVTLSNGQLSAAANNVLTATGSVNMTLSGVVWGTEE